MGNFLANITILLILTLIINIHVEIAAGLTEPVTKVFIKNEIYGPTERPELVYTIQTPKIIDFDFILALDSSGSVEGDERIQKDAIVKAVPDFIRDIPKLYPEANFNISIVSWDDNIDFAYDANKGYNNNVTSNTKLADLNISNNDIRSKFPKEFSTLETETTDLSKPIKASLDILDSEVNRPNEYHKYLKFVILVVGNGEFKPATNELIRKAQERNYKIYIIGMDLKKQPSEIRTHLEEIAQNSKSQYIFLPTGDLYPPLNESLDAALRSHLKNATNAPVAEDVKISETLYCYYKPDRSSVKYNGKRIDANSIHVISNQDGTNTVEFEVPGGLYPNTETKVTFDVDFDPGYLPVTLNEDRKQISLCSPKSDTRIGEFSFNWWLNREPFKLQMQKADRRTEVSSSNRLTIQSSESKRGPEKNSSILENAIKTLSISRILQFK